MKQSKITLISLIFLISIFIILLTFVNSQEKEKDLKNDKVNINQSKNIVTLNSSINLTDSVYFSAPYVITKPGYAEFEIESKYDLVDVYFIIDSFDVIFKNPEIDTPRLITYTDSYTCLDKYPKIEKNTFTCIYKNGSIEFEGKFDSNKENTFFWNGSYVQDWESLRFNKEATDISTKELTKLNNQYVVRVNLKNGKNKLKVFIDISSNGFNLKKVETEYWIIVKPVGISLDKSILNNYYIDPFINTSGSDKGLNFLNKSLVAAYNFDETGAPIIDVYKGRFNNTVVTGQVIFGNTTAVSGTSVYMYDDTAHYFLLNESVPTIAQIPNNNYSIVLWIYWKGPAALGGLGDAAAQRLWQYDATTNDLQVQRGDGKFCFTPTGAACEYANNSLSNTTSYWAMVTFVCENSSIWHLYLNDTEILRNSTNACSLSSAYKFGTESTGNRNFGGMMDNLMIFNASLNRTTVADLYNYRLMWNKTANAEGGGDVIKPNVIINYPANTTYNTNSINFNVTVTDETSMTLGACWVSLNGGVDNSTMLNTTSLSVYNYTNSSLKQGGIRMNAYCNDSSNNMNNTEFRDFFIDSIYPVPNITYPTNTTYNSLQTLFNYTIIEANLDTCWYSNGTGSPNVTITCGNNVTGMNSSQGGNRWVIWINDTANNINSSAISFFIDSIFPNINITYPTSNDLKFNSHIGVNYSVSDINTDSCWYTRNEGITNTTLANCANISGVTWYQGINNITIYINDTANNINFSFRNFSIDTVLPVITKISPTNSTYATTVITFNVSINENVSWCGFSLDGNANISMTINSSNTGANYTDYSMTQGEHSIVFACNDTYNNMNSTLSTSFFIDSIYPNINITFPSINFSNYSINNLQINYTVNDTNLNTCWYTRNSGITNTSIVCNINITGVTWYQGYNNVTIWVNDTANNLNSSSISFFVDTLFPLINITYPMNKTYGSLQTILNYTIIETNPFNCWYTNSTTSLVNYTITCGNNVTGINSSQGNNKWTVWINDSVGNINSSSVSFFVKKSGYIGTVYWETSAILINNETYSPKTIIFNNTDNSAGNISFINVTNGLFYYDNLSLVKSNDINLNNGAFNISVFNYSNLTFINNASIKEGESIFRNPFSILSKNVVSNVITYSIQNNLSQINNLSFYPVSSTPCPNSVIIIPNGTTIEKSLSFFCNGAYLNNFTILYLNNSINFIYVRYDSGLGGGGSVYSVSSSWLNESIESSLISQTEINNEISPLVCSYEIKYWRNCFTKIVDEIYNRPYVFIFVFIAILLIIETSRRGISKLVKEKNVKAVEQSRHRFVAKLS